MTARGWRAWALCVAFEVVVGFMVVRDAPGNRTAWALAVIISGVAALGVGLLRGLRNRNPGQSATTRPRAGTVGLAATERAVYSRWVTNPVLALVGVGVAAAMFASGRTLPMIGAGAWLYLVAGVACIRVHIDDRGVKVTAWPFGRPQQSVPLDRVEGARVVEMGRHWWWGLRWLATRRTWAFRVSGRQGLEVAINSGESLLVAVPDAAVAAGLLNDLVDRMGPLA